MPIAVFRSLAGMVSSTIARGRSAAAPRRRAGRPAVGEALEERRMLVVAVTPVPAAVDPTTLGNAILIANTGLTITGGTYVGVDGQGGTFTGFDLVAPGNQRLNIRDGVLLTSGTAVDAEGPNDSTSTTTIHNTAGDPDLDLLVGGGLFFGTEDANSLTVNFTTDIGTRSVLFDFIFGSEEFDEFLNSPFNDTFGAYLDGNQVSLDVSNRPITVNNNFFRISNLIGQVDIEYDGLTPRIRTTAPLNPTITNHTLKFVIADTGDAQYDSGVFVSRLQGSTLVVGGPTTELPNPGVFTLGTGIFTIDETAGITTIVVNRINGTSGRVSVDFAVTGGTATDALDFTGSTGTLFFEDGQTSQTITIPILDDLLPEGDETVLITLSNPDDAGLGTPSTGTLTILDNELAISIVPPSLTINELVGTATLTVSRSGPIDAPATVDYATADGTAVAPDDYAATSGTLAFAAGQRTASITVSIAGDFDDEEQSETFTLTLSNPTGGELGTQPVATVTIDNVDRPPSIFDITAFAPQGRITGLHLRINDPLQAGPVLDPANYGLFVRAEKRFNAPGARSSRVQLQRVPLRGVDYDVALRTIVLRPVRPLKNNVFYEVYVRSIADGGVISSANVPLDGDFDRNPGQDFVGYFGRGTRLTYFDRNGDRVRLGAGGGGVIEVFRDISRDARTVRFIGAGPGSYVYGTVTRTGSIADRVTQIGTLILGGAQNRLSNPPFIIGYMV